MNIPQEITALKPDGGALSGAQIEQSVAAVLSEILLLGGLCADRAAGQQLMKFAIESGVALAGFREWGVAQGSDPCVVDDSRLEKDGRFCRARRYDVPSAFQY